MRQGTPAAPVSFAGGDVRHTVHSEPVLYYGDGQASVHWGDAAECISDITPGSVQSIVTSPPYYDLRDYGTAQWEGGNPKCDHGVPQQKSIPRDATSTLTGTRTQDHGAVVYRDVCGACGARRVDKQVGIEPSLDAYVERLVGIFDACRTILAPTATLWLNLGDAYGDNGLTAAPWRVAMALRDEAGWQLRAVVIWDKSNGMPESVKDRPTDSHEYVFMLAPNGGYKYRHAGDGRHVRSVWRGPTAGYKGDHVAVMPIWLVQKCILLTTTAGDTVLDPFAGSGTVLAAAVGYRRNAIGIDLHANNCAQAVRRVREEGYTGNFLSR